MYCTHIRRCSVDAVGGRRKAFLHVFVVVFVVFWVSGFVLLVCCVFAFSSSPWPTITCSYLELHWAELSQSRRSSNSSSSKRERGSSRWRGKGGSYNTHAVTVVLGLQVSASKT